MTVNYKSFLFIGSIFSSVIYPVSATTQDLFVPFLKEQKNYNGNLGSTIFSIEEKEYNPKEKLAEVRCGTISETEISIGKKYATENSLTELEENELLAAIEAAVELDEVLLKVKSAISASKIRRSSTKFTVRDSQYVEKLKTHKVKPLECFHQIVFQHSAVRQTNIEIQNPSWWLLGSPEIEDLENLEYLGDPYMSIEAYPTDSCNKSCQPSEEYKEFRMRGELMKSLIKQSDLPHIGGESAQGDHVVVAIGKEDQKFYLPIYIMSDVDQDYTIQNIKDKKHPPWIEVLVGTGLRKGNIRAAQRRLQELGHKITIDGIIGPETVNAIRSFQQGSALKTTGQLDSPTRNALFGDGQ